MCGIVGFIDSLSNFSSAERVAILRKMSAAIINRGPDDGGVWQDADEGIGLSHRRLSILDLSPAGHQPMVSASERFVITFNGEIYNHNDLRNQLGEHAWRGHSDTETLLAGFDMWGVEATIKKTIGMFAFAVWDRKNRILMLCRDRLGEKPLYYGWQGGVFLFGSELKALKAHPAFCAEIDRNALTLFLRHNCIPAPHSIYQGIYKLPPGQYLSLPLADANSASSTLPLSYWRLNDVVDQGLADPFKGAEADAVDALHERLSASVAGQMLADVPLGAFLSGGVDSSAVVALMQAQSSRPVKTFTIGFDEDGYDEAAHAKLVARHLGTEHTELYVSPEDALEVIPRLASIYCEPFADSSQIPTFLVCQLAKQHVTVALSGDGGDELFGGYNRYLSARKVWGHAQHFPLGLRHVVAGGIRGLSPENWDWLFASIKPILPQRFHLAAPGDKAHKLADVLALCDEKSFYSRLVSHWNDPTSLVIGASEPKTLLTDPAAWSKTDCFEHWMMAMDTQTYMPDDILTKVDRAAMANSLETRVPMLDHRVVELAWQMPLKYKIRNGQGKWLLRQVLYKYVPKELIERPKQGFGIPLDSWLRGPLREWAEELLDASRLKQEGFFYVEPIRKLWTEHLSGRHNWSYHLWSVLMFQAWLETEQ